MTLRAAVLVVFCGVAALVLNGHLAEFEDRAPGGFYNPDGTLPPRPLPRALRIAIAILGLPFLAFGVYALAAGLAEPSWAERVLDLGFAAAAAGLGMGALLRRRGLVWFAGAAGAFGIIGAILLR